jgi:hypothetical protein
MIVRVPAFLLMAKGTLPFQICCLLSEAETAMTLLRKEVL